VYAVHVAPKGETERAVLGWGGNGGQDQLGHVPGVEVCCLRVHVVSGGDVRSESVIPVGPGVETGGRPREPGPCEAIRVADDRNAPAVVRLVVLLERAAVDEGVGGGWLGVQRTQHGTAEQQQQRTRLRLHLPAAVGRPLENAQRDISETFQLLLSYGVFLLLPLSLINCLVFSCVFSFCFLVLCESYSDLRVLVRFCSYSFTCW
jgi:hypothetical protein